MPYSDPEKAKAARKKSYAKRYQDEEFAAAEAARKAAWYQANKARCAERLRAWRAARSEAKKSDRQKK